MLTLAFEGWPEAIIGERKRERERWSVCTEREGSSDEEGERMESWSRTMSFFLRQEKKEKKSFSREEQNVIRMTHVVQPRCRAEATHGNGAPISATGAKRKQVAQDKYRMSEGTGDAHQVSIR